MARTTRLGGWIAGVAWLVLSPACAGSTVDVPADGAVSATDMSARDDGSLDAEASTDAEPSLDASPDASRDASAAPSHDSFADLLRRNEGVTVYASSSREASDSGRVACDSTTNGSCLSNVCPYDIGCLQAAAFRYESTPAEGTSGPPLVIDALFMQVAARGTSVDDASIVFFNHGGTTLDAVSLPPMLQAASLGYAVVASHYRGAGTSDGEVEGCLGEADDVKALADLALEFAPRQKRVMMGGSHGGCVTLAAIQKGAPIDVAAVLFPGIDSGRRYKYNKAMGRVGGPLETAGATCAGARNELRFVREAMLAGPEAAFGAQSDWETADFRCDDPAFAARSSDWAGREDMEEFLCSRSPLATATHLDDTFDGDLLIIHGERDPYIEFTESCHYAEQAGRFELHRVREDGTWATSGASPCEDVSLSYGPPDALWSGDRHMILIQSLGHGDGGRASLTNVCQTPRAAEVDALAYLFSFVASKLR